LAVKIVRGTSGHAVGDAGAEEKERQQGCAAGRIQTNPRAAAEMNSLTPAQWCEMVHSQAGGESAAIAYSLSESCKVHNSDPQRHLQYVLKRIADHRRQKQWTEREWRALERKLL
jgi:hypothetical protein